MMTAVSESMFKRGYPTPSSKDTGNNIQASSFHFSELEREKLSSDLSLFLTNPNLTKSLSDGSLDLISYSNVIEEELQTVEAECISIYYTKTEEIASLKKEIETCDSVLASLQEMLLGFQADLSGLSSDIRLLQEQSHTLEVQLRNRKSAERELRDFLEQIVIPPNLSNVICHKEVSEVFMQCVKELNDKYAHVTEQHVDGNNREALLPSQTPSGREMKIHIEALRLKAVARIRDYFLARIAELRKPRTNVRMIQVNSLLKYSPLNSFLYESSPEIYREILDAYVDTMSRTLALCFRTYQAQLNRLDSQIASRNDLIAVEDATLRDLFSSKVNLNKRGDTFFLGDRVNVLDLLQTNARPIIAHMSLSSDTKYPYEMLFRSVLTHLMDSATNELVFAHQFFMENGTEVFHAIFQRTLSAVLEQIENYLFNCYDCLAVLLMIKLTHAARRIMRVRKVLVLENFFEKVSMLLWPRLKVIMDAQLRSIRLANAQRLGGVELHAHYVSRRYAEFTSSVLLILNKGKRQVGQTSSIPQGPDPPSRSGAKASPPLSRNSSSGRYNHDSNHGGTNVETYGRKPSVVALTRTSTASSHGTTNPHDTAGLSSGSVVSTSSNRGSAGDMLINDLSLITSETIALLDRLADELLTNKRRIVFLINNYDQIVTVFQERRVSGCLEMTRFMDLLLQQRELFVEEELLSGYAKMIQFVQQTELRMSQLTRGERLELNESTVEGLVRDFAASWRKGIESINRDVLSYFSNFRNGMEILKQVLTQLLLYYTRFQEIIRKTWRNKPPIWTKDLVSTSLILAEIKKYALSI
jgi:hypothetical protein